jgi:predicted O-methyltransferase YrrM
MRANLAQVGPERVRSEGDFSRVALPNADADVLRDLLLQEEADVVLEIGLAYGVSALAIAEALISHGKRQGAHLIIDAFQHHFQDAGWKAIETAGLADLCSLLRERSQLALPRLLAEGLVADAAFVDGSHIFHNVFVDLFYLREIVRPGGLVILDDCAWPSVATAVRYFEVNTGWEPQPLENHDTPQRVPAPRPSRRADVRKLRAVRIGHREAEACYVRASFSPDECSGRLTIDAELLLGGAEHQRDGWALTAVRFAGDLEPVSFVEGDGSGVGCFKIGG